MADRDHGTLSIGPGRAGSGSSACSSPICGRTRPSGSGSPCAGAPRAAVRDVAHDIAWTVAARLNKIVPLMDLSTTIRAAVLYEFGRWHQLTRDQSEQVKYPIVDPGDPDAWLADPPRPEPRRRSRRRDRRQAERQHGVPPETAGYSLRQAWPSTGNSPAKPATTASWTPPFRGQLTHRPSPGLPRRALRIACLGNDRLMELWRARRGAVHPGRRAWAGC